MRPGSLYNRDFYFTAGVFTKIKVAAFGQPHYISLCWKLPKKTAVEGKRMKHLKVILAISFISAGCIAQPIPESTSLNSEKYTLRFVLATGEGKVFESIEGLSEFRSEMKGSKDWVAHRGLPFPQPDKNGIAAVMDQANATYIELASVPIDIGREFSLPDGSLRGIVRQESDHTTSSPGQSAAASFELKYEGRPIKLNDIPVSGDEWHFAALGRTNKVDYVLIKLYEPQK